jgi:hypothetical protein|tara:strand:- start:385 stop:1032 length:648 start_codon:yes stop_codon:yes gene_type:complete
VKKYFIILTALLVFGTGFSSVYAHTTVEVDTYEIEVGWQDEPPVVGILNAITIDISEPNKETGIFTNVTNGFRNMDATVISGGATKILDINSDPRPGHYYAKIIPTKIGSMEVKIQGELNGTSINVIVPIEDVESTSVLDFPPTTSSASGQEIGALKNALSSLQKDVSNIKSNVGDVNLTSDGISVESAYNFGVFGLSLGAAAVILAIIAMLRRK